MDELKARRCTHNLEVEYSNDPNGNKTTQWRIEDESPRAALPKGGGILKEGAEKNQ